MRLPTARAVTDVSLYEMLDAVHQAGIPYELDPDDLREVGTDPVSRRVAETSPPYASDQPLTPTKDIPRLRERFRPSTVRMLFIGESSPAGGTHFYLANSNLFRATRAAFASALGPDTVPDGASFLPWFRDRGYWLVDIADEPVNQLTDVARREAVERGLQPLADLLREVDPDQVVAIKRDIEEPIRQAMARAEKDVPLITLPFPVRQWRPIYERELAELLRAAVNLSASPSRHRR